MLKTRQKIYLPFKCFLDFLFALIAILILLPLIIVLSIIVKCTSKGPILFKQERIGKNLKHFKCLKFRTMRIDAPSNIPTHLLNNPDAYITKVGRFLRKTSLDELPQLFNILILQMSFVGPRPALYNQDDLMDYRKKNGSYILRPGLTGYAQVNGRDTISIEEKSKLDGVYFKKFSFWFDIKIFFSTFIKVFKEENVEEGAHEHGNK